MHPFEAFARIAGGVSGVLLREPSRRLSSPSGQLALLPFLADHGSRQAFKRSQSCEVNRAPQLPISVHNAGFDSAVWRGRLGTYRGFVRMSGTDVNFSV